MTENSLSRASSEVGSDDAQMEWSLLTQDSDHAQGLVQPQQLMQRVPESLRTVILATRPQTIKSLHFSNISTWSAYVGRRADAVEAASEETMAVHRAFQELLQAPKVLRKPATTAQDTGVTVNMKLRMQMDMIGRGELSVAELEARSEDVFADSLSVREVSPAVEKDRAAARANNLANRGHYKRAMQVLLNDRLAEVSQETIELLCGKFPRPTDEVPELPDMEPTVEIEDKTLENALKKVANGSAACLHGWTGELLQSAVLESDSVRSAIKHLACDALNDKLSESAIEMLLVQRLIALDKNKYNMLHQLIKRDVRPIGVSTSILKLIEHIALSSTDSKAIQEAMPRFQFSFIRGGCEIAVSLLQDYFFAAKENSLPHIIIKRDGRNAFNTMKRSAIAHKLMKHPDLKPLCQLFRLLYSKTSAKMAIYDPVSGRLVGILQALEGVIQGTVTGGHFFSLGQQDVLERVADAHRDCSPVAIMDDVAIPGPVDEALACYQEFCQAMTAECGVDTNHEKAQVLWCGPGEPPADVIEKCKRAGLPAPSHSLDALGIMITQIRDKLDADLAVKLVDIKRCVDCIKHPNITAQNRHALLRFCVQSKLNYLCRCLPPSKINDLAKDCDAELIRFMMDEMAATPEERRQDEVVQQMGLPIKMGGLGVRPIHGYSSLAAWWSSQAQAATYIKEQRHKIGVSGCNAIDEELKRVAIKLRAAGVVEDAHFPDLTTEEVDFFEFYSAKKSTSGLQHHLTHQMDERKYEDMVQLAAARGDQQTEARLRVLKCNPTCRIALVVIPRQRAHRLPNAAMQAMVRDRLGLKTHPDLPRVCCCGRESDPINLHQYKCNHHAGSWVRAHDQVVPVLSKIGEMSGGTVKPIDKDRSFADYKHEHHNTSH